MSNCIRNIAILAHVNAGKTSTVEAMLYRSAAIANKGTVDKGTTTTDFLEVEKKRKITVQSAVCTCEWTAKAWAPSLQSASKLNFIDTPGHLEFHGETKHLLSVADGAVLVIDPAQGIAPQTRTNWSLLRELHIPTIIFMNKIDARWRSFYDIRETLAEQLRAKLLSVSVPGIAGGNNEKDRLAILSLFDNDCENISEVAGTALRSLRNTSLKSQFADLKADLTESLAEIDDDVAAAFMDDREVTLQNLAEATFRACRECVGFPLLAGSALIGSGVGPLLDALVNLIPAASPFIQEKPATCGVVPFAYRHRQGESWHLCRAYGNRSLIPNTRLYNPDSNCSTSVKRICAVSGIEYKDLRQLRPGDIGAITGLPTDTKLSCLLTDQPKKKDDHKKQPHSKRRERDAQTVNIETLSLDKALKYETSNSLNSVVVSHAFHPTCFVTLSTKNDSPVDLEALIKPFANEDPSLRLINDPHLGLLLCGVGHFQLQIVAERLRETHGVDLHLGDLQVWLKELLLTEVRATEGSTRIRLVPRVREATVAASFANDAAAPTFGAIELNNQLYLVVESAASTASSTFSPDEFLRRSLVARPEPGALAACSKEFHNVFEKRVLTRDTLEELLEVVLRELRTGPLGTGPLEGVDVEVFLSQAPSPRTIATLPRTAALAVRKACRSAAAVASTVILEPTCLLRIRVPLSHFRATETAVCAASRTKAYTVLESPDLGLENVEDTAAIEVQVVLGDVTKFSQTIIDITRGTGVVQIIANLGYLPRNICG